MPSTSRFSGDSLTNSVALLAPSDETPRTALLDAASTTTSVVSTASVSTLFRAAALFPAADPRCATLWFPHLHPAAIWVRAWRRHHLVPWEKFRLDSYFGCRSLQYMYKNQLVVFDALTIFYCCDNRINVNKFGLPLLNLSSLQNHSFYRPRNTICGHSFWNS